MKSSKVTKEAATAEAETDVAATEEDMAETEEIVVAVTEEEAKEFAITSEILEAASSVMTVVLVM